MRTLYTRDASGSMRFWRMELDPSNPSCYRTVSGVLGGAEVPTGWTQAVAKNVGRSNATTPEEQAALEVEASYRQKLDRKYHEDPDNVGGHKFFAPMLAKTLKRRVDVLGQTCFVQPKLDGYRCVASAGGLISRQGKPWDLPHVAKALAPLFRADPDLVLDGELYNHALHDDFNTLGSLIKRGNRTPDEEARVRDVVQYHVYDLPSHPEGYRGRVEELWKLARRSGWDEGNTGRSTVRFVETFQLEAPGDLDRFYSRFMEQGYEGAMVRLDAPYEPGRRSGSLLKLKDFQDCELGLVDVQPGIGNWAGIAKTATVRLQDGREQSSGMRGSQDFLRQLLLDWRQYSQVTVRYQNLTPDGFLRFPVIVDWHVGERSY